MLHYHDFHLFGIVPSVALAIDIPESPIMILFFFSNGATVCYVLTKDKITQPSSCLITTVLSLFSWNLSHFQASFKLVLVITSDGGPDHRVCFFSIQVSMSALFTKLEYACKCALTRAGLILPKV